MTPERRAALVAGGAVEIDQGRFFGLTEAEERVAEFRADLARRVRHLRQGRGLSQREMARLMEVSQSRIPAIEKGEASIEAIATALATLGGELGIDPARLGIHPTVPCAQPARRPSRRVPRSTGPLIRPWGMAAHKAPRKHEPAKV